MLNSILVQPARSILLLATAISIVVLGATGFVGASVLTVVLISGGFLAVGLAMTKGPEVMRDMGAATALIGQAIALTAAFQGHPWQIDTHMLFFALLACLILLRSIPALLMATAITAVHHLSLSVLTPALIYPGGDILDNIGRTVLHAVIVVVETAVLCATVVSLNKLTRTMEERNISLEATLKSAHQDREKAEAAKREAETAQAEAKDAQTQAEDALRASQAATERSQAAEQERLATQEAYEREQKRQSQEQAEVVRIIRHALKKLKDGDLTARIEAQLPEDYEDLRTAFNDAVQTLDTVVAQVAWQSQDMKAQVQEIESAARDLALRTERQAQALQQSTDALEGLTKAVKDTVATVSEADGSAKEAQSNAKASEGIVAETSQAMHAIQTESAEIAQIVKVIDEIAFQTNLLALNAGVEAARAGDAGRGFAVVASEVRGLALRSSESATNIRELIDRSGKQVETGTSKIEETVTSLSDVLAAVHEITARIGIIADGAQEQTAGLSELNQSVSELDTTTQRNVAMVEETSAACTNLLQGAQALQALTQSFQTSGKTFAGSSVQSAA